MERSITGIEAIRPTLEDTRILAATLKEDSLLNALRKLTAEAPNLVYTYVLGNELVVAVKEYALLSVNLDEGKVKIWSDWKARLASAAKDEASCLARRMIATLIDKGESISSHYRDELRILLHELEKAETENLAPLLDKVKTVIDSYSEEVR